MDMFENSTWDREAAAMSDMVASSNESEQGTPSHLYSWEFHVKPGPASTEALRRAFGITRAAGGAVDLRNEDRKELEWWNGIEAKW